MSSYILLVICSMECIAVSQEANTLHVKFKYTDPITSNELKSNSSKYICGALFTEFKFDGNRSLIYNNTSYSNCNLRVSVRFQKLLDDDDIIYKCQFESSEKKLLVKELIICDKNWHQIAYIHQDSIPYSTAWSVTFDVTLNCEITKWPCIFASLYDDTESADFKLCGYDDDDGSVKIHKTILAAHSPVLQTMLAGEWKESKEGSVALRGVSLETLQHLKDFMYLNSLPETGLQELCVLASYYMMPKLVVQCCAKLLNKLTIENAIEMAEFASRYRVEPLYIAILKAMRGDTAKIDKLVLNNKTKWMDVCKKINTIE